jgi:transposase
MIQKENYEAGKTFTCYVAMAKQLTEWRNSAETPWLKEAPCHPLQHALKNLDRAYKNFFAKRADFPRFKRRGMGSGFRYPDPLQIKLDEANSRIFLPKLGWMRYRKSREIVGEVRNVTVTQSGTKWFVSIQTEREVNPPQCTATTPVGIDVGIVRFATLAGTKESPGKQVRQKSNLNRSILDQGWGMFRRQLEYKLNQNGGMLLAVPPANTSRTCPSCDHISEHNRKTQSQFECVQCGYKNNADVVGALNILERGHRLLACGEIVHLGYSKKKEPTKAKSVSF